MAGELQAQHVTGATVYAVLVDANGGVWNGAGFDATPTSGEWTSYDIAMTEQGGSGYYAGDLPAVSAGRYGYRVHKQLGGSPAATDPVVWTGENVTGYVASVAGAVGSVTGTVGSVTGSVGSVATGGIAAASIASSAAAKIADVVLRRSWASASASSDGDTLSFRSLLGAVAKLVNKVAVSGSTLTVYKEDDSTSLGTQTVTADAAAEPIVSVDTVG